MTETMLERMAFAILGEIPTNGETDLGDCREAARAVLQAIRDGLPESVIRAGDDADYFCSEGIEISRMISDSGIQTVFTAIIDAILAQSQEGNHP